MSRAAAVDYVNVDEDQLVCRVHEALQSPAWAAAPNETDPRFRKTWSAISVQLQIKLRDWILTDFMEEVTRCAQRLCAHTILVYAASRPYHPPDGSFEFVRDPSSPEMPRVIVRSMRKLLSGIQPRIYAAGMPELACRYRPELQEDIRRDILKRPASLLKLIAAEGILIDTIVTLGAGKGPAEVRNFVKLAGRSLQIGTIGSRWRIDQRTTYVRALEETSRQLQQI